VPVPGRKRKEKRFLPHMDDTRDRMRSQPKMGRLESDLAQEGPGATRVG
jgi:hypothetical protein